MSVSIEVDLKEVLDQINQKLDNLQKETHQKFDNFQQKLDNFQKETNQKLDTFQKETNQKLDTFQKESNQKFEKLDEKVDNLTIEVITVKGDIKALDEKVGGIGKRLENQEFISRGVLIALIVTIIGGFAKLFGVVGNP
jgi:predicted nuclease with TOPRIM domain